MTKHRAGSESNSVTTDAAADQGVSEKSNLLDRLGVLRGDIDEVDTKILQMLNQRASLSLEVGRIKQHDLGIVLKPQREREILATLEARNMGPLPQKHMRAIWREIFSSSRAMQRPQRVAYLGPEGTFSYFAALEYLGHAVVFQPCPDLHHVFRSVQESQCELGIVPLENSLQGTVGQSFDLFLKYHLQIQAELYFRVSHCLLSTWNSMAEIETVYSHPQPLAQCGAWLRAILPTATLVPVESTSAAAHRALKQGGEGKKVAAIGHARLAKMLPLNVLARSIEDEPNNWTRFVMVANPSFHETNGQASPLPGARGAIKTSILFTLPDKAGALSSILELFSIHKVNMRKLESRPLKGQSHVAECWKYVFFADVECYLGHSAYAPLVDQLQQMCTTFRILGSYPSDAQGECSVKD